MQKNPGFWRNDLLKSKELEPTLLNDRLKGEGSEPTLSKNQF
jgi:hypothetical protein